MIYPQFNTWLQYFQDNPKTFSAVAAFLTLHMWCLISRVSYNSFLMGAFSVIAIECFLLLHFLRSRINQRHGSPITLELAKIEVAKIFGDQLDYYEVVRKLEKKKYFENNKAKFVHFLQNTEKAVLKLDPSLETTNQEQQQILPPSENKQEPSLLNFSHKEINHLLQQKISDQKEKNESPEKNLNKSFAEEKIPPIKLGKKVFVNQLNELTDILSQIGACERSYGKLLDGFEYKSPILLTQEEEEGNSSQFDVLDFKILLPNEIEFLNKVFKKKLAGKQYLCLPGWGKFKQTINFMGLTHINFSRFVHKAVKPLIEIMISDHESKYKEVKKEKKRVSKEYEEDYTTYTKLRKELESLKKTLDTTLTEYQVQYKKKADDETILKLEMKARLTKSQIDSQTNKVSSMTDRFKETKKLMLSQNLKNFHFVQDREDKKNAECYNIFKNVILGFTTDLSDIEKSFKSLMQFESSEKETNDLTQEEQGALTPKTQQVVKRTRRRNASEAYSKAPVRMRTMSINMETKSFEDLAACTPSAAIEDIKLAIEEQNQILAENENLFEQETKKNKFITGVIETLAEFQIEYYKEMEKLMTLNSLNSKVDTLTTFWRITQNGFATINQITNSLHQKLNNLETAYENCIKAMEKEFSANETSAQKVVKKAVGYLKIFEKEIEKRDLQKNPEKNDFFSKLFNFDDRQPMTDEQISTERNNMINELELSAGQLSDFITKYKSEAIILKKTLIIFYLQYLADQQSTLTNLLLELEQIYEANKKSTKIEPNDIQSDKSMDNSLGSSSPNTTMRRDSETNNSQSPTNNTLNQELNGGDVIESSPENTIWINKMLKVFALEWAKSGYFKEKIMKSFFKAFNKKRSKFIRRMNVKDVIVFSFVSLALKNSKIDPTFPDIRSITPLPSNNFEFLYDFHLAYQGNAYVEIETRIEPQPILSFFNGDEPIPLSAKVLLKGLNAKVRLCWVPSEHGRSWFSFVGQPVLDVVVEPKVGISQFDISALPQAKNLITELIMMRVKKMIYPYRKELDLPMAFRDPKIVPPPE